MSDQENSLTLESAPNPETQAPQQPQFGYAQPQQPQYDYSQSQYPPQQPYGYAPPQPPYGYGRPLPSQYPGQSGTRRAVGSMVLMIISISFLTMAFAYFLTRLFDRSYFQVYRYTSYYRYSYRYSYDYDYGFRYYSFFDAQIPAIIGAFSLLAATVLMLVGAIRGKNGRMLFSIGVLLVSVFVLCTFLFWSIEASSISNSEIILVCSLFLTSGIAMAGIACMTRINGLKIAGGILMLIGFVVTTFFFLVVLDDYSRSGQDTDTVLNIVGLTSMILLSAAVLCFPARRENP